MKNTHGLLLLLGNNMTKSDFYPFHWALSPHYPTFGKHAFTITINNPLIESLRDPGDLIYCA
jgi:hypothetical protein